MEKVPKPARVVVDPRSSINDDPEPVEVRALPIPGEPEEPFEEYTDPGDRLDERLLPTPEEMENELRSQPTPEEMEGKLTSQPTLSRTIPKSRSRWTVLLGVIATFCIILWIMQAKTAPTPLPLKDAETAVSSAQPEPAKTESFLEYSWKWITRSSPRMEVQKSDPVPPVQAEEVPDPVLEPASAPVVAAVEPVVVEPTPEPAKAAPAKKASAKVPAALTISAMGGKPSCVADCAWGNLTESGFPMTVGGKMTVVCGDKTWLVAKTEKITSGPQARCYTTATVSAP